MSTLSCPKVTCDEWAVEYIKDIQQFVEHVNQGKTDNYDKNDLNDWDDKFFDWISHK
jgi:hypothetical protein